MMTADAERRRLDGLLAAEQRALDLFARIEASAIIAPGRTEREVEKDIYAIADRELGVQKHWHKRIVRTGVNTLATASDNPPIRTIAADDVVYLDIGPVFEEWEADVGRTYAIGADPRKQALCRELPIQFDKVHRQFLSDPNITGDALYRFACKSAEDAGWRFGGRIAGHIVAEFPHARLPGARQRNHISLENPDSMRQPDLNGDMRYWILEIHLVDDERQFGGFYERLMLDI